MPNPPRLIGAQLSHDATTHNRVLTTTSDQANELAHRWHTTKQEVYRWLVELAMEGHIEPLGKDK